MDNQTTEYVGAGLFYDFCGGVPFWNESEVDTVVPRFSTCLIDTALVWVPYGFLWVAAPGFILYMYTCRQQPSLPFTVLHVSKAVLTILVTIATVLRLLFQEQDGYDCDGKQTISPAAYTAVSLKFLTNVLAIILLQLQRHRGIKTSGVPFTYWLMVTGSDVITLYNHISSEHVCKEAITVYILWTLEVIQLILHCFVERPDRHGYVQFQKEKECPEEDSSILSHITFSWMTSDIWKTYRKRFSVSEFWNQTPKLQSQLLAPVLERAWEEEISRVQNISHRGTKEPMTTSNGHTGNGNGARKDENDSLMQETRFAKNGRYANLKYTEDSPFDGKSPQGRCYKATQPSLYRTLINVFWKYWWEATLYMAISELFWLVQPLVLRYIIQMIEGKNAETILMDQPNPGLTETRVVGDPPGSDVIGKPIWQGVIYSALLFLILSLNSIFYHLCFHHMMTLGLKIKTSLICIIYKKALNMKRTGVNAAGTVGETVNLMSVDCQRIQDSVLFSFYLATTLPIVAIGAVQLWGVMGFASLGSVVVLLAIFPLVGFIGRKQFDLQTRLLQFKGERIKILNEILCGIKVLKMYAWESSFMDKVKVIRAKEISCLRKYAILSCITILFAIHTPFMMNFTLLVIYVLTSPTHFLSAEQAFTALNIVNILRYPVALMPFLVNGLVQAYASVGRIEAFLRLEDIDVSSVTKVNMSDYAVDIDDGTFAWDSEGLPFLRGVNVKVKKGQLVAVVGQVGSGKSSLVSAILGEMEKRAGEVKIQGSVAYVPQEAWIQNMTLRDNILFGKAHNERSYKRVLDSCALLPDLEILAGGDMTEIGEKGINISGGQKQRVSLARALYSNADNYLLDDPLSAVDSHVGKHLFKRVIGNEGLLGKKTRILVTHGVHWLPMVDQILVMKDGVISECGTYEELIGYRGEFADFLHTYLTKEEEEEEEPEIQKIRADMRGKIDYLTSEGALSSDEYDSHSYKRSSSVTAVRSRSRHKSGEAKSSTALPAALSRLTVDESSEDGSIKPIVLLSYIKAMGSKAFFVVFLSMSLYQGLNIYSNFWLTYWTEDPLLRNTSLSDTSEYEDTYTFYIVIYLILGILQGLFVFICFYLALTRMVQASEKLHNSMLCSILKAPMSFFDTTPIGRMINRFSSDVDIMDNKLPDTFRLWTIMMFSILSVLIVITISTPTFLIVIVPVAVLCVFLTKFYLPTARQMRRVESVLRSPIYNHFSESITGASVIRAYECGERFVLESRKRVDENIKFFFTSNTGTRWIGLRLEIVGNIVVFCAAMLALVTDSLSGADVGLSVTYAVQITVTINLLMVAITEMEMNVVSAERVLEYTSLPAEAQWTIKDRKPNPNWPVVGEVEFRDLAIRYRPGLDLVLKGITCRIHDGEMVGIVGRTGAGKSSLTLSLFRLIEAAGGSILVDGINIADIGLHDLRSKLTILPQDPVMFSGSLRSNLDPFGRYDDTSIWKALGCAHLKEFVKGLAGNLDYECGEGGQNLSVGQRQLVCLARTLLHKTKILILDEATAAVDMETDDLIQDTIRSEFKDCTIITIAHRLNTILDYDRVMVLDQGRIQEFDAPGLLLQDPNTTFYSMAKDAGIV